MVDKFGRSGVALPRRCLVAARTFTLSVSSGSRTFTTGFNSYPCCPLLTTSGESRLSAKRQINQQLLTSCPRVPRCCNLNRRVHVHKCHQPHSPQGVSPANVLTADKRRINYVSNFGSLNQESLLLLGKLCTSCYFKQFRRRRSRPSLLGQSHPCQ